MSQRDRDNRYEDEEYERNNKTKNPGYSQTQPKGSGVGIALAFIAVALIFIIGPIMAPKGLIGGIAQAIIIGFGILLLLIGTITLIITRLYIKTSADEAFVRTGMGGPTIIMDGGAIVIPVVHNMIKVSLQTMRLDVERLGKDALLTGDKLRADVIAEFYIRVQKDKGQIMDAAMTMGQRTMSTEATKDLVFQKLENALRAIGFTRTLEELNKDREGFAGAVKEMVEKDLKPNGLTLETVTISKLDQTDPKDLKEDNVFDAQGRRTIAEIVQTQRVLTNELIRNADKKVKEQDVGKEQFILLQDVTLATATAEKESTIRKVNATKQQEAETVTAEQERIAGVAHVKKDEGIQAAGIEKDMNIEVAIKNKEKAINIADIGKDQATALAERGKEIAVAGAETNRAEAEAKQQAAEKLKETEKQGVITVTVLATAEREKDKQIIGRTSEITQTKLNKQMEADVISYTNVTVAEGELTAASKKADAKVKLATADKDAKLLQAEGDQAVAIVPVNVEREKVNVKDALVAVERKELANKAEFSTISSELTIRLALIEMFKAIGIEQAQAMGEALSNAKMQMWGSTDMLDKVNEAFYKGQSNSKFIEGIVANMPPEIKEMADKVIGMLTNFGKAATEKLAGKSAEEKVEEVK